MSSTDRVTRTRSPWVMEDVRDFSGEHICFIRAEGEGDIARTRGTDPARVQANAEFIVRAANAHDDLLGAAQELADRCTDCGDDEKWHSGDHGQCSLCDYECRNFHAFTKLRVAIALATL